MALLDPIFALVRRALSSWTVVTTALLLWELLFNLLIVWRVRYTEIDWLTYMEQVAFPIDQKVFDYDSIHGKTGPLVYPGGHVLFYGLLRALTGGGEAILRAQLVFVLLYLVNFALVAAIYAKAAPRSFPPWLLFLLCVSKRVHSVFALRLFNDGPVTVLAHAAVLLLVHRKWLAGCVLYSSAVAVKMSAFCYAPALAVLLLHELGPGGLVQHIAICAVVQLVFGAPFLVVAPVAYIRNAYNFGRTFKHKWSVNFKWVPCEPRPASQQTLLEDCDGIFTSRGFAIGLLVLMLGLWCLLAHRCWLGPRRGGFPGLLRRLAGAVPTGPQLGAHATARALFGANFVGIACARSLHFQFYVWYFFSLPLLLWSTCLPRAVRFAVLLAIEVSWNPWSGETSSWGSSLVLTAAHVVLLAGLLMGPPPDEEEADEIEKEAAEPVLASERKSQ